MLRNNNFLIKTSKAKVIKPKKNEFRGWGDSSLEKSGCPEHLKTKAAHRKGSSFRLAVLVGGRAEESCEFPSSMEGMA